MRRRDRVTITRDVTAPTVFTLNAPAGGAYIKNGSAVSVAAGNPTDAGAGVADVSFRACPGSNGCTWTDGDAFAVGSDTTDQYATTWPAGQADGAYQLIARATDNVGNVRDTASPVNVTLDNTNPSQTLALNSVSQSGGLDQAFKNGTTVYYRGTTAGSFKVRSSVTDGGSGPASATFAALGGTTTGWTFTGSTATTPGAGTYDSNTYSWAGSTTSSPTASATPADAVGDSPAGDDPHVHRRLDGAVPRLYVSGRRRVVQRRRLGRLDHRDGIRRRRGPAPRRGRDPAGLGQLLRRQLVRERLADMADRDRDDELVVRDRRGEADERQRLHHLASRDRQRRERREPTTRTFTYDTAAPTFGTLALGSPTNASVTGTTVYYRSGVAGSFTLSQPLSDTGGSGAASVQFPAIATAGWTHGNETVNGASPYIPRASAGARARRRRAATR